MNIQYLVSYGADNAAVIMENSIQFLPIINNYAQNLFLITVTAMSSRIASVLDVRFILCIELLVITIFNEFSI